jgi:dTDP-4-dehydrorhamnose 3,5-epimerase
MEITKTKIEGLLIIKPDVFPDERGYFYESFNIRKYQGNNIETNFVQDNISKSRKGTLRGLHYQVGDKAQGKLCFVLEGRVLDVAVDLRLNSPTFGKHFSIELSEDNHLQFWIPVGFGHGFSVLSDTAIFQYKCTNYYSKENERTILYNDPVLNIDWKIDNPIVSTKDLKANPFQEFEKEMFFFSV